MMKIKLKNTRPVKLTKHSDMLIMSSDQAIWRRKFLDQKHFRGPIQIEKGGKS